MFERALGVEEEIGRVVSGTGPIFVGPWLAEVGYEVLYWVPFLRWVQDRFRVNPERLIVVSRGGVQDWYRDIATRYVEIFDVLSPQELSARNEQRQTTDEGGGRKQSKLAALDEMLLMSARSQTGVRGGPVLHPSHLFRLFQDVWRGNLPMDFLWSRTRYARVASPSLPEVPGLPEKYVAVKLYTGAALSPTTEHREALSELVRVLASRQPVVMLETGLEVDDHGDYMFEGLSNVISARDWMTPGTNLGVQTALIAHADYFLGTCGGLAWLAPFLGVPSVAVYADDSLLSTHLLVSRQAGRQVSAADLLPVDLRALRLIGSPSDPLPLVTSVS